MDKKDRYKEIDLEVLDAIKSSPSKGLYFADLVKIRPDPMKIHKVLRKLISKNFLSERSGVDGAYFYIAETNQELIIEKVVCPMCNTIRRIRKDHQITIHCANPDCRTARGVHRNFWLVNIDHWRKGSLKMINRVN